MPQIHACHTFIVNSQFSRVPSFENFPMAEFSPLLIHPIPSEIEMQFKCVKTFHLKYNLKY